ncbi:MAG: hypothetical protein QOG10_1492 [Kribbellaceae bacterium]|nr:hypothetical protein [Kribbellaceae bacterium]
MHDVLAHKVSLIALHAGGLEVNPAVGPEKVESSAGLIRETARQAMEDLRGARRAPGRPQHRRCGPGSGAAGNRRDPAGGGIPGGGWRVEAWLPWPDPPAPIGGVPGISYDGTERGDG